MSFVVGEDTYVSVADADEYWNNHSGGDNWATADPSDKEKALREATQYIDKSYEFRGSHPYDSEQLLSWPRIGVVDAEGRVRKNDEIPKEIANATAWLAEQALESPLVPSQNRGGKIDKIKAGEVSIDFSDGAPSSRDFKYVTLLISDLITSRGSSVGISKI